MQKIVTCLAVFAALTLLSVPSSAQTEEPDLTDPGESVRHVLGIFFGLGTEVERAEHSNETSIAVGLEYAYALNDRWLIGGTIETLGGKTARELVGIAFVDYHLTEPWFVVAGLGAELTAIDTYGIVRIGTGYIFEFDGGYEVAPAINIDFIEKGQFTLVYGAFVGRDF